MQPTINQLRRYKVSEPFSKSLNEVIKKAFKAIFVDAEGSVPVVKIVEYEPYETYLLMFADIRQFETLLISSLNCENTIFGSAGVNQLFRAVHDYLHYLYSLDFSYESELIVNYHQNIFFRNLGASQFDLDLLNIETAGQIVYHKENNGAFPDNQREFAITELQKLGY